jgi:lipid-binding SYLF domain-containing protein
MNMKRQCNKTLLATVLTIALASALTTQAEDEQVKAEQAKAQQAVANFKLADPSLTNFFAEAVGYAIFPSVGEGGFIVGAVHGKGLVYEKDKVTGTVSVTAVSVGAQVGGGAYSELIFFQTEEALKSLKESSFEMTAGAKATLAASGAAANAKYEQGVALFTLPKGGAMIQAAVGGQKFKFEPLK